MMRRGGWSAVEVLLASAVASGVMLAAGTLWGTMNRRTGQDLTRAALNAQLEGYATILEFNIRQSSSAFLVTRNGQQMLAVRRQYNHTTSASYAPQATTTDPSGVIAYDSNAVTVFLLANAANAPDANGSPLAAYVWGNPVTSSLNPISSTYRDLDGRSVYPAIQSQSFSVDVVNQTVTFTLTASSRNRMAGGAVAPSGAGATTVSLTRTVAWRYSR